jgi:hypothetical protein
VIQLLMYVLPFLTLKNRLPCKIKEHPVAIFSDDSLLGLLQ